MYPRPLDNLIPIKMAASNPFPESAPKVSDPSEIARHSSEVSALELTQVVMDRAAEAIFWISPDGKFSYVNEAGCRLLGYRKSELLNLHLFEIQSNLSVSNWSTYWSEVKQQDSLTLESEYETKQGELISVEITINHLEFKGLELLAAFVRDITIQKTADAQLLEAKEQLEAVLDAVPGLVSWVSSDLRYLGVNRHLANAFKLPPQSFVGQEVGFLDKGSSFNEFVYEFFKTEQLTLAKEVTTYANERAKTYLIVAQKYHQGQAAVFVGLDISQRQEMEVALRCSEEQYRTLSRNFPNGFVVLFDQEFRYTLAEGTELEKIGLSKELMEGKTIYEVFPEGIYQQIEVPYRDAWNGIPSVSEVEYENQIYSAHILPLMNEQGQVFAGMMMTQNITERKQAMKALQMSEERLRQQATELEETLQKLQQTQTQLIQTEKMSSLGQLVAGVAHEINNPVSFISGNISHAIHYVNDLLELVETYQEYYPNPAPAIVEKSEAIGLEFVKQDFPKLLTSMTVGAERIRDVVRCLRQFTRQDGPRKKPIDIHQGLESTLLIVQNRLQAKAGRTGITLKKEYGDLPLIDCYAGQLNQVFMHLITNAIDALESSHKFKRPPGTRRSLPLPETPTPTIWIETEVLDSEWVQITIEDNGPGMTTEVQKYIFDPLFTTKPLGKGTGLGLSIAHHLVVDKHGGNLECISRPGEGTKFVIKIPVGHF